MGIYANTLIHHKTEIALETLISPDMLHELMDYPQINYTKTLRSELGLFTIILMSSHFWEKWVKYYQGVNLDLLKCKIELDLIFCECTGRDKKLFNLLTLIIKRFICVTKCNKSLTHFYLINDINMLNLICKVEKLTGRKTYLKQKYHAGTSTESDTFLLNY